MPVQRGTDCHVAALLAMTSCDAVCCMSAQGDGLPRRFAPRNDTQGIEIERCHCEEAVRPTWQSGPGRSTNCGRLCVFDLFRPRCARPPPMGLTGPSSLENVHWTFSRAFGPPKGEGFGGRRIAAPTSRFPLVPRAPNASPLCCPLPAIPTPYSLFPTPSVLPRFS